MKKAAPEHINLARYVLAEASSKNEPAQATVRAAAGVFEKLRLYLGKFVGVAGFHALAERALALANAETDCLDGVQVNTDGTFDGFGAAENQERDDVLDGMIVLLAQLLGLLATFIGPALTLRMLQDIWPNGSFSSAGFSNQDILKN